MGTVDFVVELEAVSGYGIATSQTLSYSPKPNLEASRISEFDAFGKTFKRT